MRSLFLVFISVFVAELGDKTQIATLLFATDPSLSRTAVFMAASTALLLSSLLAVVFGDQISRFVSPMMLKVLAGFGFIVIGVWTLLTARA
jgi:putative Ca2+/H+ antiporter (TMEM165/GDT1 family)